MIIRNTIETPGMISDAQKAVRERRQAKILHMRAKHDIGDYD